MRKNEFEQMKENLDEYLRHKQELPDTRADLRAFVEKIRDRPKTIKQIVEGIEETEHAPFIRVICQYLIMSPENKTNCVFIHGAPNAGKTQFLKRLSEIFDCTYYMQTRSHFDTKLKNGRTASNFVLCEEGALSKFFDNRD